MGCSMDVYGIVGAGGFGREVMPLLEDMIRIERGRLDALLYFVVEKLDCVKKVNGIDVIALEEFLAIKANNKYYNVAIADAKTRERIASDLSEKNCKPFSIKSKSAVVLANNEVGSGSILCPFVTVTSNVKIGKFFHANIYSYVAHDCIIGDFVTFAPKVSCNGNVVIEDYAYIGTGAVIKQGSHNNPIVIGRGAVIGMGAVVTKSVPPHDIVIGNPAKSMKKQEAI